MWMLKILKLLEQRYILCFVLQDKINYWGLYDNRYTILVLYCDAFDIMSTVLICYKGALAESLMNDNGFIFYNVP